MEIHIDLVGGIAGDIFIGALLDAFPEHVQSVLAAIETVTGRDGARCSLEPVIGEVLAGQRFKVKPPFRRIAGERSTRLSAARQGGRPNGTDEVAGIHARGSAHSHVAWSRIRERLQASDLEPRTVAHAVAIFELLAVAEAFVHGIAVEDVTFHEVGAWDSIADIVGAAQIISCVDATRWTASPAPLGAGRIRSAHGVMCVPAPATTQLLLGLPTIDDGIAGERITPTGAAILRYLCPPADAPGRASPKIRTLVRTGTGFGTRKLQGLSNHLRVLCFEESGVSRPFARPIHVLEFEVDDQSGEDLAMGLDRLRTHHGVLDVTQAPVFGKKGRMMTHVRVLARDGELDSVSDVCFRETTTIGLRHRLVEGIGLARSVEKAEIEGHPLRVKVVNRPGGKTAKTESDDVLGHESHANRARLRAAAEQQVLGLSKVSHAL